MLFLDFLTKLNFYYSLTLACMPMNDMVDYSLDSIYGDYLLSNGISYYADIDLEFSTPKDHFFIGGGFKSVFAPKENLRSFVPLRDAFDFNIGMRYNRFQLGFRHYCTHPVALAVHNRPNKYAIHGAYEEIYLTISNR